MPAEIAATYARHGAACLSVLTDRQFFQGDADFLQQARAACGLPVLRKDFMVDAYQVDEARALGRRLHPADRRLPGRRADGRPGGAGAGAGHGRAGRGARRRRTRPRAAAEDAAAGHQQPQPETFEVTLDTTLGLLPHVPADRLLVTESGILGRADVQRMREAGVHAFLVGEAFMRAGDPGAALADLFAG